MPTARKESQVAELTSLLSSAKVIIAADYRGLKVSEITDMRRKLRDSGSRIHVAKNTLTSIAAKQAGVVDMKSILVGPTALIIGRNDAVVTAKQVTDYIQSSRSIMTVRGGVLGPQVLNADQVKALASLPPKPQIVAQLLGGLQSPLTSLLTVLQGNMRSLVTVLDARCKQMEESVSS